MNAMAGQAANEVYSVESVSKDWTGEPEFQWKHALPGNKDMPSMVLIDMRRRTHIGRYVELYDIGNAWLKYEFSTKLPPQEFAEWQADIQRYEDILDTESGDAVEDALEGYKALAAAMAAAACAVPLGKSYSDIKDEMLDVVYGAEGMPK